MTLIQVSKTMSFREADVSVLKECQKGWWTHAFIRPYPDISVHHVDNSFEHVYSDAIEWCQGRFGLAARRWKPDRDLFILFHRPMDAFEFKMRWC